MTTDMQLLPVQTKALHSEEPGSASNEFYQHPLYCWVKDAIQRIPGIGTPRNSIEVVTYTSLCNGVLLNNLMLFIDVRPTRPDVCHFVCDQNTRLRNLSTLLNNIVSFYRDILNSLVVMPLPDLLAIAKEPERPEANSSEMKKILLLLLGCAVQSSEKEQFIERITNMDVKIKESLAEHIKKVTEDSISVLNVQALQLDPHDSVTAQVLDQLHRVCKEREGYAQTVINLSQDRIDRHEPQVSPGGSECSSESGGTGRVHRLPEAQQHEAQQVQMAVQLAESKAKLRRVRMELDEKVELLAQYKDELSEKELLVRRIEDEKGQLARDAASAKTYRDEVDILRERVCKTTRLEEDCQRYREKLTEFEYYKSRVDELRAENHALLDRFDEELSSAQKEARQSVQAKEQAKQAQTESDSARQQLEAARRDHGQLLERHGELESKNKLYADRIAELEDQLEHVRNMPANATAGSLSDQLNDTVQTRLHKLERENEKLRSERNEHSDDTDRLSRRLTMAQEEQTRNVDLLMELREKLTAAEKEKQQFENHFYEAKEKHIAELNAALQEKARAVKDLTDIREAHVDAETRHEARLEGLEDQLTSMQKQKEVLETDLCDSRAKQAVMEKEKFDSDKQLLLLQRERDTHAREMQKYKELLETTDRELEQERLSLTNEQRKVQRFETMQKTMQLATSEVTDLKTELGLLHQQLDSETRKTVMLRQEAIKESTRANRLFTHLHTMAALLDCKVTDVGPDASPVAEEALESAVQEALHVLRSESKRNTHHLSEQLTNSERHIRDLSEELESNRRRLVEAERRAEERRENTAGEQSVELAELRRQNELLSEENGSIRDQVRVLQERAQRNQSQNQQFVDDNMQLKQQCAELKAQQSIHDKLNYQLSALQVEQRQTQAENDLLLEDNKELRQQNAQFEKELGRREEEYVTLDRSHKELLEQLSNLQTQLTGSDRDYEGLCEAFKEVETKSKELQLDNYKKSEEADLYQRRMQETEQRLAALVHELQGYKNAVVDVAVLQNESGRLKRDLHKSVEENYQYQRELHHLRGMREHVERVRQHSELLQHRMQEVQAESTRSAYELQAIKQLKCVLEEENRTLLSQMGKLITENAMLNRNRVQDKEHFHNEQKDANEKLHDLRRQKEKLEEKIMDHYKSLSSPRSEKSTASNGGIIKSFKQFIQRDSRRGSLRGRSATLDCRSSQSSPTKSPDYPSPSTVPSDEQRSPIPSGGIEDAPFHRVGRTNGQFDIPDDPLTPNRCLLPSYDRRSLACTLPQRSANEPRPLLLADTPSRRQPRVESLHGMPRRPGSQQLSRALSPYARTPSCPPLASPHNRKPPPAYPGPPNARKPPPAPNHQPAKTSTPKREDQSPPDMSLTATQIGEVTGNTSALYSPGFHPGQNSMVTEVGNLSSVLAGGRVKIAKRVVSYYENVNEAAINQAGQVVVPAPCSEDEIITAPNSPGQSLDSSNEVDSIARCEKAAKEAHDRWLEYGCV